ncbi:hypothetical protein [Novosphingobium sp.]|uniref:hypothetical protein n=1 Tax=Novosphingobium sp. TaxID=1874826 RepID=UPI0025ED209B|nr:hypothetical protein [Novosphingobium sp.]
MNEGRALPILTSWIERFQPKPIIGVGLAHTDELLVVPHASDNPEDHSFEINGHSKRIFITQMDWPLGLHSSSDRGPNGPNSNEATADAALPISLIFQHHLISVMQFA